VFHFAAPASLFGEAETATLSRTRAIPASVLCGLALILFLCVPRASSQQPAVSSAAAAPFFAAELAALPLPPDPPAPPSEGSLSGKVSFEGTPAKYKSIDMSPEPNCA